MQRSYLDRLRAILGGMLGSMVVLAALLVWLPAPTFTWWMGHFIAVELGRPLAACGLAAALAVSSWRVRGGILVAAVLVAIPGERTRLYTGSHAAAASIPVANPPPKIERDVSLSADVVADLHVPQVGPGAAAPLFPLVVVVHGGSWRGGDKGEVAHVTRSLAARGALVADIRYRLAPANRLPVVLGDVKCALGKLRARPDVDPARVFLLGRSAGGHLVLMAALTAGLPELPPTCDVPDAPVTGVAALYPATDLVYGYQSPPSPDAIDNRLSITDLLGFSPADAPDQAALGSPVKYAARAGGTRILLIHGEADRLVPVAHAERFVAALQAAGVPEAQREIDLIPGADHGFDHNPGGAADTFARGRIEALVFGP